jgi:pimeloyl-ACP methyl ester carboxylesterase
VADRENTGIGVTPPALKKLVDRFDPEAFDAPKGSALIHITVEGDFAWDVAIMDDSILIRQADGTPWDAELIADSKTWAKIADDINAGMDAFRAGKLHVRKNLHLGIGFLAATSGMEEAGRLEFGAVETSQGRISMVSAGEGDPVICLHGLGATKASFMTTIAALSEERRVIAIDFPGFGDSAKPLGGDYDAPYFARVVTEVMDELEIDTADVIGNSMGGRVALELGLLYPERVGGLVLLAPALAWLRDRRWRWLLSPPLPMLGLIQPAPRVITEPLVRGLVPGGNDGWTAAGIDEFLRAFLTPRGRVAFYESARNIYLDEPYGEEGLWTRLEDLKPPALFVWGKQDTLVPIGFRKHVERVLDSARHLELNCGHVPQLEKPDQTHDAAKAFLDSVHVSV